jgi:hypothetical protein
LSSFSVFGGGKAAAENRKKRAAKAGSRLLKTKIKLFKVLLIAFFTESHDFGSNLLFLHFRR